MLKSIRNPKFWHDSNSLISKCIEPLAKLYYSISSFRRNSVTPKHIEVPVVCVGSVLISGAGKTPTVELICNLLKNHNYNPHILSSGSGGYLKNVVQVDPSVLSYLQVGDESLLSAMVAPTWIGKNRIKASDAAISSGADILIMDDGFRNNSLVKDYTLLVVDSEQQFANGYMFPAGPLTEPIESGIRKSDAVLIIGNKNEDLESTIKCVSKDIPIFYATIQISEPLLIKNKRIIAFCGLGYPKKFKKTLHDFDIVDFVEFSDHHPYTITELHRLINKAKTADATLVTTTKDYVKIPDVFANDIKVLHIKIVPSSDDLINHLLNKIKK